MGENSLVEVKEPLTQAMMDSGTEVVRRLDQNGVPINAAFWLFMPEINEWRLGFASPDVAVKGPLAVYGAVRDAIKELGKTAAAAPFSMVMVMEDDAPVVKLFRLVIQGRPGTGSGGNRVSKTAIDGQYIGDAFIYRVQLPAAPSSSP